MMTATLDDVRSRVNRFYEELPFNIQQSPDDAALTIRRANAIRAQYPALHTLLQRRRGQRLLDVGSGAGWFSNTAATHYPVSVAAIDLCDHALGFARQVSTTLGVADRVAFHQRDIFTLEPDDFGGGFDVVNSLGVLHHTHDCRAALDRVLPLVAPGGFLHLGLYHLHGRRPFLDMFADIRDRLAEDPRGADWSDLEDRAFARYASLYPPTFTDQRWLRSWFRDQVLHPHETQHTAREVHGWLSDAGFECLTTSLAQFAPVTDWAPIFEDETSLAELSYRKNVIEHTYYPGFFIMVAQRPQESR